MVEPLKNVLGAVVSHDLCAFVKVCSFQKDLVPLKHEVLSKYLPSLPALVSSTDLTEISAFPKRDKQKQV